MNESKPRSPEAVKSIHTPNPLSSAKRDLSREICVQALGDRIGIGRMKNLEALKLIHL